MRSIVKSLLHRLLKDTSGQTMFIVAAGLFGLIGISGLAIDMGGYYSAVQVLQASNNVAALAGAAALPDTNAATNNVHTYSSETTGNNASPRLTLVTATPSFMCLTTVTNNLGIPCRTATGTYTGPVNAMKVVQTATVPLWFGKIFGITTWQAKVTSTVAMNGFTTPTNIAIIVDATPSQQTADSYCPGTNVTELQCELNGIQTFLKQLYPCKPNLTNTCTQSGGVSDFSVDRVAIFTVPTVTIRSAPIESQCTSTPTDAQAVALGGLDTSGGFNIGWGKTPAGRTPYYGIYSMEGSGSHGGKTFDTDPTKQTGLWTHWATATTYTFPTVGATSYHPTGDGNGTYELSLLGSGKGDANGFFSDYRADWLSATGLNTSSLIVKLAGGGASGCGGVATPNYDMNIDTYYGGAMYAAQSALTAEQANFPGSANVIIIMGDGNATAPQHSYYSAPIDAMGSLADASGNYPSYKAECGQAITAAKYASSYGINHGLGTNGNTTVYTIAYGSPTTSGSGNCDSDHGFGGTWGNVTPCQTMQKMATTNDDFFTANQQGASNTCTNSAKPENNTSINAIFNLISAALTKPRLIPNGTT